MRFEEMVWYKTDCITGKMDTRKAITRDTVMRDCDCECDLCCPEHGFKIIDRSCYYKKGGYILMTYDGTVIGRFDTILLAMSEVYDLIR